MMTRREAIPLLGSALVGGGLAAAALHRVRRCLVTRHTNGAGVGEVGVLSGEGLRLRTGVHDE